MGSISSLKRSERSYIIDPKNPKKENQLYVVELNNKEIITNDEVINDKHLSTKNTLFNQRSNGIFNSWLTFNREQQEVVDLRHKIYSIYVKYTFVEHI